MPDFKDRPEPARHEQIFCGQYYDDMGCTGFLGDPSKDRISVLMLGLSEGVASLLAVDLDETVAYPLRGWCVALASIIYFSALESTPVLHAWLIPILLAITVPVTTLLLARAALFRKRMAEDDVPAEVSSRTQNL